MQLLLIKITTLDTHPECALLGKKQAEDRFAPTDWSKVRSLSRGRRVVLLIPNSDVVLTSVNIPSKNKKQLHQAVPFALEDTLAEDIEELHFAIHQASALADSQVAVINRQRLDLYIDTLRKKGITIHFILPQVLALPRQDKGWSIVQQMSNRIKHPVDIRLSDFVGFSCDKNLLELFLTEQLEKSAPESITSNINVNDLPQALQTYSIKKVDPTVVHYKSIENALPLNLLTGFVSHKRESNFNWKAWRPPLVLASLVAATWLGIVGWQNNELLQQKKQLNQAIEKTFTTAFPKSRIVDAPQQMKSKLAQLKKNIVATVDSPLPLISGISPLFKEFKDLTLMEIRYQENELVLVMKSPNLTRLETFKNDAAKKTKLNVSIKSSTTTANSVEAILIIAPLDTANINGNNASHNSAEVET